MRHRARWTNLVVACTAAAAMSGACARGDKGATADTAGAVATTTPAPDSGGMAGMSHANMPGMNRPAAKDADHEFLRMMSDHHAGLVQMASAAMSRASQPETQADAHKLHTKQEEEQKRMVAMIQTSYGESLTPMVMPKHQAMNDSLQAKSGPDYDRTFYGDVIAHHREGIAMTDQFMSRLTKPEVKQMAEKMKSDQQKEIAEFERKLKNIKG
jgi:uncharacterized protein (DUF305 family)